MPNRRPISTPSPVAHRWVADSRLLTALAACPAPTGPATTTRPSGASTGRTASTCSGSPPAMIVSVPAVAPGTPPDTGASTRWTPRAASRAASARVRSGSDELMSTMMVPLARLSSTSATTDSTTVESGSIRMTTLADRAASAVEATSSPPAAASASRLPSARSEPITGIQRPAAAWPWAAPCCPSRRTRRPAYASGRDSFNTPSATRNASSAAGAPA